ncbi:MAG: cytochrome P450 [Ktedonobacteraceae bacterium]|nr:cytochrome P450 [Ktedonobacteraceae bacterium]
MTTITIPKQTIPGPHALPLLGWRAAMLKLFLNPFATLRHMHDRYGDVVALAHGDPSHVVAFGPAMNFQLLSNPDLFETTSSAFVKLPKDTALGRLMVNNLPVMIGEKHKQHRHVMQPTFHKQQVALYRDDMVMFTQHLLDQWQEQEQTQINVHRAMQQLTQRIAIKTLFGLYDEAELQRVGKMLRQLTSQQIWIMIAPIDVPGTPYHHVMRLAEQMIAFTSAQIAQKRSQPAATDVLATLVHAHDEDGTKLNDDELIGHAFTIFVAGHETTANALTWTLFLLDQHPRICADLLDELDGSLHGDAPTIEQLHHLPLLDGIVKESLRLLPPAAIGIRTNTAPCELGGFAVPKGANIMYSEFITQRLPELYEEPDRFKPQRWATLNRTAYEYLPFSAGRHRCIGAEFATQEMKVVLPMLLQRYRFSVVPNTKIDTNLGMRPAHGMPMRIVPQDRQFQRVAVGGNIQQLIDFA